MNKSPLLSRFWKNLIVILTLSLIISPYAFTKSKWEISKRYADVYKQYLNAKSPLQTDNMKHFVYFAREREAIHNHSFLTIPRFNGAQIMYSWKQLEPAKDQYDFSMILSDYNYLGGHGKQLFIQLQDATFDPDYVGVPDYLLTEEYDGGAIYQRNDKGEPDGWVAKRWNPKVRNRFAHLLEALGRAFDGKIEGINLQETAIGVSRKYDPSFSPELYVKSIKANMQALKNAFPQSTTMQYANFMPGEDIPWDDRGYLRSIYQYGEEIKVGLGAPDLMVKNKVQLNNALAMMHEGKYTVPLGIAVQDGNYIGETGVGRILPEHDNIVPMLHAFAKDFLKVKYMFWATQEPYFHEDVVPCFSLASPRQITGRF